jgi:hypothetical protein
MGFGTPTPMPIAMACDDVDDGLDTITVVVDGEELTLLSGGVIVARNGVVLIDDHDDDDDDDDDDSDEIGMKDVDGTNCMWVLRSLPALRRMIIPLLSETPSLDVSNWSLSLVSLILTFDVGGADGAGGAWESISKWSLLVSIISTSVVGLDDVAIDVVAVVVVSLMAVDVDVAIDDDLVRDRRRTPFFFEDGTISTRPSGGVKGTSSNV